MAKLVPSAVAPFLGAFVCSALIGLGCGGAKKAGETGNFDASIHGDGDGSSSEDGGHAGDGDGDGQSGDGDTHTGDGDTHGGDGDTHSGDGDRSNTDAGMWQPTQDVLKYVDPFIGTDDSNSPFPVSGGAGGSTYPGAVVPFGMVQLSPDTPTASPSGYRYKDGAIESFSLTHFDGAGCPNNEDLPFLPAISQLTASPGNNWGSYRANYDKNSESAAPGYYAVTLNGGIKVELTTTTRTGFARINYPASTNAQFLIHAGKSATGSRAGSVEIAGQNRIRGSATAGGFCGADKTFMMYFALEFDHAFSGSGTWTGGNVARGSSNASGTDVGAFATFDTTSDSSVSMKIGVSFVSIENAEANLAAENPGFDFEAVRKAAEQSWNKVLSRVDVTGGSTGDLTKFYTALYHVFQNPNVASDVNGQYMGFDRVVHKADGWTVYQNYSGWDIIRSWTHLVSAIAPETPDIIHSMVQDGVEGGLLPFWTHENVETNVMVGDPGTVNVANAYAMGVRGFDTDAALKLMVKSASNPNDTQRWALSEWINDHYLDNAAMTLEYAMADFAISQFAGALGNTDTRDQYLKRSTQWKESWNAQDGFVEPRVVPASAGGDAARIYEVQVTGPDTGGQDLAQGGNASASGQCNANENAGNAVNGTWTAGNSDKWCDNSSANKWLQIDLKATRRIDTVVIYHSGAGGESNAWDTQDFTVRIGTDGNNWTTVASVTGNKQDVTTHKFNATNARYVRIDISTAIQKPPVGSWACQPLNKASQCGYTEGNAAQYVWMVPHDLEGLFKLMGGHQTAVTRLDDLFTELNAGTERAHFYIGNEPEHGTPWTYNFAQAPWKTQEVVRRIVDETFTLQAGGLPGNDDLGATSAWLVWAYLGMYPVIPGSDVLVVHGPQFASSVVHLANGKTLTIRGAGAGEAGAHFVQDMKIDGTSTSQNWLHFADVARGATLDFTMGSAENHGWGSADADRPPSFE